MKKFMTMVVYWADGEYEFRIYRCRDLVVGYILAESRGNDHYHFVVYPGHAIKMQLAATYDISRDGIEQKLIDIAEDAWQHDGNAKKWMDVDRVVLAALPHLKNK